MPHVEKLANVLVLFSPIFPLTILGTIQGGLAHSAVRFGLIVGTELRILPTRYWMSPPYVRHRCDTAFLPRGYRVY
jgi:hypothetical protein